jgi:hypothetical protein
VWTPKINELFGDEPTVFLVDLRNYSMHYAIPVMSMSTNFQSVGGPGGPTAMSNTVSVNRIELLKWDGWRSKGKSHITSAPGDSIDIVTTPIPEVPTCLPLATPFTTCLRATTRAASLGAASIFLDVAHAGSARAISSARSRLLVAGRTSHQPQGRGHGRHHPPGPPPQPPPSPPQPPCPPQPPPCPPQPPPCPPPPCQPQWAVGGPVAQQPSPATAAPTTWALSVELSSSATGSTPQWQV